ncbi:glyoxalase superfamily protein [Microlunatus speluncae]|uniref:glyoxalase superfamily protein n=1 Tax=Microlunatus speluncae TaxID=2594267 RepID=UPI0012666A29|nr:glyoxalase superfamily protein [Microlunatus speluncae]
MRNLPDRPNLDHLRQQAKELRVGLKPRHPDLTLSEAQALLAEEYGFRSWPDLKAEVDRRRTDDRVAPPELAAAVAVAFGLGRPTGPMRPLELAWAGQIWSLITDRGSWRVTEIYEYTPTDNIEAELRLVEAAVAAGISTREPIRNREDHPIAEVDDRRWRVHRDLAYGLEVRPPISTDTAIMIGGLVGTLHRLRLPAPGPVHSWLTCRPGEELFRRQLARSQAAGAPWSDALERALPRLLALATIVDDREPAEDPILSHGSPGPGTICRGPGAELVLTNWDHACATPPSWEFASVLESWSVDPTGRVDEAVVAALIQGYRQETGATPYLGMGMFSGMVTGFLNWTESRINLALGADTAQAREEAARELTSTTLQKPLTRAHLERILTAAGAYVS